MKMFYSCIRILLQNWEFQTKFQFFTNHAFSFCNFYKKSHVTAKQKSSFLLWNSKNREETYIFFTKKNKQAMIWLIHKTTYFSLLNALLFVICEIKVGSGFLLKNWSEFLSKKQMVLLKATIFEKKSDRRSQF